MQFIMHSSPAAIAERKSRVEDFRRRAIHAPREVYHHLSGGWPYIPVHRFAEEIDGAVTRVDCWCLLGADCALLECSVNTESGFLPGLYARVDADSPHWPKLYAILREALTRRAIENVMQRFVELGFPDALMSPLRPGGSLVKLSTL
jgi:hypothetical protein